MTPEEFAESFGKVSGMPELTQAELARWIAARDAEMRKVGAERMKRSCSWSVLWQCGCRGEVEALDAAAVAEGE